MKHQEITPYQENQTLKKQFQELGLDLEQVMDFTPMDLDLENRRLQGLLDFVMKYRDSGESQEVMAALDKPFPPIFPMISPESDWYRFKLWLEREPLMMKLRDQAGLPPLEKSIREMTEEEVVEAIQVRLEALEKAGIGVALQELPPPAFLMVLCEMLEDEKERMEGEGWWLDGCSGYCPGCLQRPWCNTGQSLGWTEDNEAGGMHLRAELRVFVSMNPQTQEVLDAFNRALEDDVQGFSSTDPKYN
jgi:hypothetical protein